MKVLFVFSGNRGVSPTIQSQVKYLRKNGLEVDLFPIVGHGVRGYLKSLRNLRKKLKGGDYALVHAHYGLSGLLSNLQRRCPVITTYHGSDIHSGGWVQMLSRMSIRLSVFNIYVAASLYQMLYLKKAKGKGFDQMKCKLNSMIIPCGVDLELFFQIPRSEAIEKFNASQEGKLVLLPERKYVVFAGAFSNAVKNPTLAKEAIALIKDKYPVELIELKGYTREQVNLLLNAADCLLMTSNNEGSPLTIKEAMAAGCPVVSVDVGDVSLRLAGTKGCYIAERNPSAIATAVESTLQAGSRTDGREFILLEKCDSASVANKLLSVYRKVLKDK